MCVWGGSGGWEGERESKCTSAYKSLCALQGLSRASQVQEALRDTK